MKLSIITINRNNKEGLSLTLQSVKRQSSSDFEYIVIDGLSTDGSVEVIKSYEGTITKWVSETDSGIYNAMNKGVRLSSGDYCLFLNSGDCLHSADTVEQILSEIDGSDLIVGKVYMPDYDYTTPAIDPNISMLFFMERTIPHQAAIIRTSQLIRIQYDETYKISADQKFFGQLLVCESCTFKPIDLVVSDYDGHGISATNIDLRTNEHRRWLKEVMPDRVLIDYLRFQNGSDYSDSDYDRFYNSLKKDHKRIGRYIYMMNVLVLRLYSCINKNARFARKQPIKTV